MKTKKIDLPKFMNFPFLVGLLQSRVGVVTTNWINQAMRHMTFAERVHRLFFEFLLMSVLAWVFTLFLPFWWAVLVSTLSTHTLFFVFNGQIYTLKRYLSDNLIGSTEFLRHIESIYDKNQGHDCLRAIVAFGSLSKSPPSGSSDFDVRLIRKEGFWNAFRAANICSIERYRAFCHKFPIDIIICKHSELVMSEDETAITLYDPERIFDHYPAGVETYASFMKRMTI